MITVIEICTKCRGSREKALKSEEIKTGFQGINFEV